MQEIDSNRLAWSQLSEAHYHVFLKRFREGRQVFNEYIQQEIDDLSGQDVVHLQCNTGADTILLRKAGAAHVTGIDLVPENIYYAQKLAADLAVDGVEFVCANLMTLSDHYDRKHDYAFTSEGVLGWLPDLYVWARTVRHLLKEHGTLYVFDSHPMFLAFDESKLVDKIFELKYPYFGKEPDKSDSIGGYATEPREGVNAYSWSYTISDILNALIQAGFRIDFFHEFSENYYDAGGMTPSAKTGLFEYAYNRELYPMSFSLRASVV